MEIGSLPLQIYFAILGAYLSVVMARILRQNGRVLRKMDEGFAIMTAKMDEGFRRIDYGLELIAKLIVEENERDRKEILEVFVKRL